MAVATTVNGGLPGPELQLREGQDVVMRVANELDEDFSIHWYGTLLPPQLDGVPGISFKGIRPGETLVYRFPARQSAAYWYPRHSGFQEQLWVLWLTDRDARAAAAAPLRPRAYDLSF